MLTIKCLGGAPAVTWQATGAPAISVVGDKRVAFLILVANAGEDGIPARDLRAALYGSADASPTPLRQLRAVLRNELGIDSTSGENIKLTVPFRSDIADFLARSSGPQTSWSENEVADALSEFVNPLDLRAFRTLPPAGRRHFADLDRDLRVQFARLAKFRATRQRSRGEVDAASDLMRRAAALAPDRVDIVGLSHALDEERISPTAIFGRGPVDNRADVQENSKDAAPNAADERRPERTRVWTRAVAFAGLAIAIASAVAAARRNWIAASVPSESSVAATLRLYTSGDSAVDLVVARDSASGALMPHETAYRVSHPEAARAGKLAGFFWELSPSMSPAKWFGINVLKGKLEIVQVSADNSYRFLTSNSGGSFHPAASPDGASIAFATTRLGDDDVDIAVMDLATGKVRPLVTTRGSDEQNPSWSPSGSLIAFTRVERPPLVVSHICVVSVSSRDEHCVHTGTPGEDLQLAGWIDDSTLLVSHQTGRQRSLWLHQISGQRERRIAQPNSTAGCRVAPSRDIAFCLDYSLGLVQILGPISASSLLPVASQRVQVRPFFFSRIESGLAPDLEWDSASVNWRRFGKPRPEVASIDPFRAALVLRHSASFSNGALSTQSFRIGNGLTLQMPIQFRHGGHGLLTFRMKFVSTDSATDAALLMTADTTNTGPLLDAGIAPRVVCQLAVESQSAPGTRRVVFTAPFGGANALAALPDSMFDGRWLTLKLSLNHDGACRGSLNGPVGPLQTSKSAVIRVVVDGSGSAGEIAVGPVRIHHD